MKRILPSQNLCILLAILLGIASGFTTLPIIHSMAKVFSTILIKSLKLISLPIIFLSIASTLSGMDSLSHVKTLGARVFKYTLITTLLSAFLAFGLYLIISPVGEAVQISTTAAEHPGLLSTMLDLYPSNLFGAFLDGNVMGIVLIAAALGFGILSLPTDQKEPLHNFFQGLFNAFLKIASFIITFIPFGIWAFVTEFVSITRQSGFASYKSLYLYFLVIILANLIQATVILPLFLKRKGLSPIKTFKGVSSALSIAFFSKSSNAALPVTLKNVEDNLGVPKRISSFSLPLCSTINMNACAAFIFTTVLFISMSYGYTYSIFDMLLWVFIATLAAIGNAGVPMGCYFLAGALLTGMGVPLEVLGLILPVYALLDMVETAVNVWSDCCVTVVVAKEEALATAKLEAQVN